MNSMWSDDAWQAAGPVYREILALPFISELAAGTLPAAKFRYYIEQDSLYLKEYGRVMAVMASRFGDAGSSRLFLDCAMENLDSERALQESYLKKDGLSASCGARISPTCLLCSSHLWRQVVAEPIEIALASVLPCFTVYSEAGRHIAGHAVLDGNPYRDWISLYGSSSFDGATDRLVVLCNEAAMEVSPSVRDRMTEAFVSGVRLEWMFWNSAYNMEDWKI